MKIQIGLVASVLVSALMVPGIALACEGGSPDQTCTDDECYSGSCPGDCSGFEECSDTPPPDDPPSDDPPSDDPPSDDPPSDDDGGGSSDDGGSSSSADEGGCSVTTAASSGSWMGLVAIAGALIRRRRRG
mgnify:CR=1 FL=1